MPNWTTAPGSTTVNTGEQTTVTSDIVISPAFGYDITPNNFIIGGATETHIGTWEGGNVGNIVKKVEFIQSSDDVLARVYCEAAYFVADSDIFVDIDESDINPVINTTYGACVDVEYPFPVNATVTVVGLTETTVTQNETGDSTTPANWTVTRYENEMFNTLLFTATITPASGYHLVGVPSVELANNTSLPDNFTTSQSMNGSSGVVMVTYTETNASQSLMPCEFGNKVYIDYTIVADSVTSTNTIHGVNASQLLGHRGGGVDIKVNGDSSTQYDITVKNTTSNKYYNWDGTWVAGSTSKTSTITSKGVSTNMVVIPSTTATVDYDITLASVGGSTLGSSVPTAAGEMQIKQYGTITMAISLSTSDTSQYDTLPSSTSVTRPIRYVRDKYVNPNRTAVIIKGSTRGVTTTRVELATLNSSVKSGMVVLGSGIPHNTTIKGIEGNLMILSAAANLPTIQTLKCYSNTADIVPVSFVIAPNGNTLSVNSAVKPSSILWGTERVDAEVEFTTLGTPNYTMALTSTSGITKYMFVSGDGIPANTTVGSVDHVNKWVVVNNNIGNSVAGDLVYFQPTNPEVEVAYLDVQQAGSSIGIKGYLLVPKIAGVSVFLYLDDIIDVT